MAENETIPEQFLQSFPQEPGDSLPVRGCLIIEKAKETLGDIPFKGMAFTSLSFRDSHSITATEIERIFEMFFFIPKTDLPYSMHIGRIVVKKNNSLLLPMPTEELDKQLVQFTVHCINFLTSPSVKLVRKAPDAALQKARQRRGKQPLPNWYEITYRKIIQDYSKAKTAEKAFGHSFRYDVRGHFKCFTLGPMAGRVIWCPPHQRGLNNPVYKPKGYRIPEANKNYGKAER